MVLKERNGQEIDMIESAVRICRGYLSGPWKKITSQDVSVERLSGGLSNILYHVKLEKFEEAKPQQVLLRLYGQTHGEGALENLITESVIFTLLSERKIGPKLYGVFPGGRIEEFIPASPCTLMELAQKENSLTIAEKMAEIHTMNVPINKEPRWIWDTMNRWLSTIYSAPFSSGKEKSLLSFNLKEEVSWLKSYLSKFPSPVVFCHNDLQEGNILKQSKRFVIIDFEYCAYNYRGFELANHFIEWTYDYTKKEYPHFSVHKDNYCPPELMCKFIERYLSTLYPNGVPKPEINNVKTIMTEIKSFTLASHLLWCIWAILNSRISQIPFGFLEYAEERFNSYQNLKNELVGSKEKAAVKRKVEE